MTEIFIEGQRADVSADFSSLLTFTVDDVRDFTGKNTSFSKTVILPGTARNNKLFGHIFDIKQGNFYDDTQDNIGYNFNAAKSARVMVFQSQVQQFKGIVRLLEIVIDKGIIEYEVAFFGELSGLVLRLGNNKLDALDFSAYDHTYNWTNIEASWDDANAGEGYYYPLIDHGNYSVNKTDWNILTFRPALFAREYLVKIFEAAGYTYECDLWDTDRFKRVIIPYNRKFLTKVTQRLLTATETNGSQTVTGLLGVYQWDTAIGGNFTISGTNSLFTYNAADPVIVTITVEFDGLYTADQSFEIALQLNSVDVDSFSFGPATNEIIQFTLTFSGTIVQNDVLRVIIRNDLLGTINLTGINGSFIVNATVPTITLVTPGDEVQMNDTIPQNILQKDFLSSIVKLWNLYIYEDITKDSHVLIKPFIDFYDVADNGLDWTFKLDRGKPVKIKPMSELNARYYNFQYKPDSDYYNDLYKKRYNEGYGDRIFDSEFEFANESDTIDVIFSATPLVGYDGEDKVYPTIFKLNNNVEEQIDSNIRIMQAAKVTGVSEWIVTGHASGLTTYGYAGHLNDPDAPSNDLNFGTPKELFFTLSSGDLSANQFNVYWSSYMAEITDKDSKLLTGHFKFTPADIYNLDFSKYIFLDGVLFRINKIEDYNPSEPDSCRVELLSVIFKEY